MRIDQNISGKKLAYRPIRSEELTMNERRRIEMAKARNDAERAARENLMFMASRKRGGFEELARWIVCTCKAGLEEVISNELSARDIEVWCPTEKRRRPPLRGKKAVEIHRAIFRGYVFVRVIPDAEAFHGVLSASRISSIMGRDGKPFLMPERLMSMLVVKAAKREQLQEDATFKNGQAVTIRSGPFADFAATVRRVLGGHKVEVEAALFGQMTSITLDVDSIEV